jgi:polyvinyl alcohol dehydrogenase (cytochrome)
VDGENMYVALSDIQIKPVIDAKGFHLEPDPNQGGGLFALRLATGEKVWSAKSSPCGDRKNCSPAQSAAVTVMDGVVFSGSMDGHLRAYSSATGGVVWDFDTVRDYETVNGQKARGGSLDCAGPVIAGGILYVNSGYMGIRRYAWKCAARLLYRWQVIQRKLFSGEPGEEQSVGFHVFPIRDETAGHLGTMSA